MKNNHKKVNKKEGLSSNRIIYKKDLVPAKDLKQLFRIIRNQLAGNLKGITRDEKLVEQLIFLLFIKLRDEQERAKDEPVQFQLNYPTHSTASERIMNLFDQLKNKYDRIIEEKDELIIDEVILNSIVTQLEGYCISQASRDAISDVFETFLGSSLRGNKGQFFTPKNIVQIMIEILNPQLGESFIDPACGTGGFLINGILNLLKQQEYQVDNFYGIDKDFFLAKITRLYMAIIGIKKNLIFCENSLEDPKKWNIETQENIQLENFDIVCTNPPFGSKIPVKERYILKNYNMGYKWRKKLENNIFIWQKEEKLIEKQPPQVLFIERCLQFLKNGGRLGIVLPDGIFGNPSDRYIIQFLLKETKILAIISCSHLAFMPYTHTKTSLLFLEKAVQESGSDYPIFMAIAQNVGHDKNGKPLYKIDNLGNILTDSSGNKIINDDFPEIFLRFIKFKKGKPLTHSHLGFTLKKSQIKNNILIPEYYNPEINQRLQELEDGKQYGLVRIGKLEEEGIIQISRGHEIGSKFYGTGNIPFIRTSDLINWEINVDPIKKVSREIYDSFKDKQDIKNGDILIVNDGTFLIGKTAMITENDTEILIQSHFKKIRVLKRDFIDENLLLWALNTDIVQEQIKSKTFIQSTISTMGNRFRDIFLPIPNEKSNRDRISQEIKEIIQEKMILRIRISKTLNILDV